jgi:hypothetical protein
MLTAAGEPATVPPFYMSVDGQDLRDDETHHPFPIPPDSDGNEHGYLAPDPGTHVLQVRTALGGGALPKITATMERRWKYHLVVFGEPAALQQVLLADDPSLVPLGVGRLRLLNALDQGQAIQLTRCANDGLPCVPFGEPIAFGDLMEMDEPAATVDEVRWTVAGVDDPTAGGQMVMSRRTVSIVGMVGSWQSLIIPVHDEGPNCAGCVVFQAF